MDAMSLLRADHLRVLGMLDELEAGRPEATVDADRQHARKDQVTELVIAESRHEAIEEQYFWPTVREAMRDGDDLAARAIAQEASAKQVLNELEKASPLDPEFEQLIDKIIADGRKHIEYEETVVWPRVRDVLAPRQLDELGATLAEAMKQAPTRPHPHTPSASAVQRSAGKLAAATDRARDAATGRGKP